MFNQSTSALSPERLRRGGGAWMKTVATIASPRALFRRRNSTNDSTISQLPPADNDDSSDSTVETVLTHLQSASTAASASESRRMIPGIVNDDETEALASQDQLPDAVVATEHQHVSGGVLLSPLRAPLIKRITAEMNSIPGESMEDTSPDTKFMVLLERPPSLVLTQKQMSTENHRSSIELVDYESRPNSPRAAPFSQGEEQQQRLSFQISDEDDLDAVTLTKMEDADSQTPLFSSEASRPIATMSSPVAATLSDTNRRHQNSENVPSPLLVPQIKVRSHGALDCTAMPTTLVPLTLQSTEDMASLAASETIARRPERGTTLAFASNTSRPQTPPFLKKKSATAIGFLSDMKQIWTRRKTPSSPSSSPNIYDKRSRVSGTTSPPPPQLGLSPTRSLSVPTRLGSPDSTNHLGLATLHHDGHKSSEPIECRSIGIQTFAEASTMTQDTVGTATETATEYPDGRMLLVETLESKLRNMRKLLKVTTNTLSSKETATELDRALGQLHAQLLAMVEQSLGLVHDNGNYDHNVDNESKRVMTAAQDEFLHFLETQARTQVKILEVEVRAGQELLRVHKSQFETERAEVQQETTLERRHMSYQKVLMHGFVAIIADGARDDVAASRAVRNRACVRRAAARLAALPDRTRMPRRQRDQPQEEHREKSELEERLALVETQRQTHEFALSKLRGEYDDMRDVAAQAQMRVEKYKTLAGPGARVPVGGSTNAHSDNNNNLSETSATERPTLDTHKFPKTTQFLRKHQQLTHESPSQPDETQNKSTVGQTPAVESNVAALAGLKRKLTADIRHQIETTKAALCEMEMCNLSDSNLCIQEEEELQRLQQRLAASSAEMDAAMEDSRWRLETLLQPSLSRPFKAPPTSSSNNNAASNHQQHLHLLSSACYYAAAEPNNSNNNAPQSHDVALSSSSMPPTEYIDHPDAFGSYNTLDQHYQAREKDALMRRDAQSALYWKWRQDRVQHLSRVAAARDPHTLKQAQQSMQRFQLMLASLHQSQR